MISEGVAQALRRPLHMGPPIAKHVVRLLGQMRWQTAQFSAGCFPSSTLLIRVASFQPQPLHSGYCAGGILSCRPVAGARQLLDRANISSQNRFGKRGLYLVGHNSPLVRISHLEALEPLSCGMRSRSCSKSSFISVRRFRSASLWLMRNSGVRL